MAKDVFGTDLVLELKRDPKDQSIKADVGLSRTGDLSIVSGKEVIIQAIRNRLATRKGELAELGHPEYGSLLEEMIGEPNTEDTRRIIETLVRECLKYEPRIESILNVTATTEESTKDCVDINVHVKLKETRETLTVTYPFYLEATK